MSSNQVTFFLRLGSTLTLWALILAAIFSGRDWAFFIVITAMALASLWEYFRMLDKDGIPNFQLTALICATIFLGGSFYYSSMAGSTRGLDFEIAVLVLFIVAMFARQMFALMRDREPLQTMAYTLFGLLWIPWMFNFITKILFLPPHTPDGDPTGKFYVLFLLMVTKFSDMGAYVFGSLFGRHKFVPHISPKKTWRASPARFSPRCSPPSACTRSFRKNSPPCTCSISSCWASCLASRPSLATSPSPS